MAPWIRMQRIALQDQIGVEHLLASSAIPFIFPAVPLYLGSRREYCGDGSMRQLAPISPAIHLGATKVLVVGAGRLNEPPPQRRRRRAIRAWRRSPATRCRRSSSTAWRSTSSA
jgi:NTE family protein